MTSTIGRRTFAATLALATLLAPAPALAQQDEGGEPGQEERQVEVDEQGRRVVRTPRRRPPPQGEVPSQEIGDWSSERVAQAAELLVGSWRSEAPTDVQGPTDEAVTLWMHIVKAPMQGLDDVMYLELHRADDAVRPYRQTFLHLYEHGDSLRLRTYEPTNLRDGLDAYAGFWKIPDRFPPLSRDNAIATMDIPLQQQEGGWRGRTEHPYPTDRFGAVQMRSEIEATPERLVVADRGYDADGTQVWGPGEGGITFVRDEFPIEVSQNESGLIMLDYPADVSRYPEEGEMVRWAYDAWLWETGRKFAGSDIDEILPEYQHPPPPDQLNNAWGEAVVGAGLGTTRRVVSPPELAYGRSGWALRGVPPNATLVFHMELVNIEAPPPPDESSIVGPRPPEQVGGGDEGSGG